MDKSAHLDEAISSGFTKVDMDAYNSMSVGQSIPGFDFTVCVFKDSDSAITIQTKRKVFQFWTLKDQKVYTLILDAKSTSSIKKALG